MKKNIKNKFSKINEFIIHSLSPRSRKLILLIIDNLIITSSIYISSLYTSNSGINFSYLMPIILCALIFSAPIFGLTSSYKSLTRYISSKSLYRIAFSNLLLIILIFLFNRFSNWYQFTLKFWTQYFILSSISLIVYRIIFRDIIFLITNFKKENAPKVAIYGAGSAGIQLFNSLNQSRSHDVKFFIDDNTELQNRTVKGIPIKSYEFLKKNVKSLDLILIAIPSINKNNLQKIIDKIQNFQIKVLRVPSIEDIASGRSRIDFLKPIELGDLLGRKKISFDISILKSALSEKIICVTGAGGSIGKELSRQILNLRPLKLILIDNNEPSIYLIKSELDQNNIFNVEIDSRLGNVNDKYFMEHVFETSNIDIVIHAAAYKHVPIVELNPIQGVYNNVFSTLLVCKLAEKYSLSHMVLVSSDKAVRPENVMGATKRLSELIVQFFAECKTKTKFTMVRFGNVLGSSGSVVPLFEKQLAENKPITITHPDITRYFMTIEEASNLVLNTIPLSTGGEVFLLDMGKPIKILDLAKKMIKISGLSLKDKNNPNGDIEIVNTGLRPGEKLYEELLIDGKAAKTSHPLIYFAKESFNKNKYLLDDLNKLEDLIILDKKDEVLKLLLKLVPEWKKSDYL